MESLAGRMGRVLGMTAVMLLLGGGVAAAHVTVAAPGVTVGQSDAAITFRVPTESATASTVGLKVALPTDTPMAGVLVAPVPGWSATVIDSKLATPITTDDGTITEVVSEIDWTADAASGIKPGFFGQFTIIAGKLPDKVSTLTFKAIQTYSDRSVVSWIQQAAPGSTTEPDHPAPELTLLPAVASDGDAASASAAASPGSAATSAGVTVTAAPAGPSTQLADPNAASKSAVTVATVIAVIAVLTGATGVAIAVASRRRPTAR